MISNNPNATSIANSHNLTIIDRKINPGDAIIDVRRPGENRQLIPAYEKPVVLSDGTIIALPKNRGLGAPEIKITKLDNEHYLVSEKAIVAYAQPKYTICSEEQLKEKFANNIVFSPKKDENAEEKTATQEADKSNETKRPKSLIEEIIDKLRHPFLPKPAILYLQNDSGNEARPAICGLAEVI